MNKNTQKKQVVINSRIETINTKLLFKDSFLKENASFQPMGILNGVKRKVKKNLIFFN